MTKTENTITQFGEDIKVQFKNDLVSDFNAIKKNITDDLDNVKEAYETDIATITESELTALHEQSPEATIKTLMDRIDRLESNQQSYHNPSTMTQLHTIDQQNTKIKILEQKIDAMANRNNNPTLQKSNNPVTPTPSTMFQSVPSQNHYLPTDNDKDPRIQINSLVNYQQGLLRLTNIRTIDAYMGPDGMWRYTAVTESNTMINDIQAAHMSIIRSLNPNPRPRQPQNGRPPQTRSSTPPVIFREPSPLHHSSSNDDYSHQDPSESEPIVMFVGHQYRYPKNSRTISRVNYAYITDKGSKWNLQLPNEQGLKPFYDQLVNRMTEAGILLKSWDTITKDTSLAVITQQNCKNFDSVYKSMSQAIFNYLDLNKNTLFQHYTIPKGYIEGFRSISDGFQVLYETLTVNHPALVDLVESIEDHEKPTMDAYNNL